MLIDTHCHLNFPDKFPSPEDAIEEARLVGVTQIIVVGCDTVTSRAAVDLADRFEAVFAVVGWHPTYTRDYTPESLSEIEALAENPKVVAIGEIGLDFHWDFATVDQQGTALFDQLDLAVRLGKPIVFHCREAYPAVLDILEQREPHPYLLHCFAGDANDAARALKLGCLFGVDGPVTYKNSSRLREVLRQIPLDRLVLETDSPYLPPVPFRGQANRPAHIPTINAALSAVHGVTPEECARVTTKTATQFFHLERG